jgi:hypothetical protein
MLSLKNKVFWIAFPLAVTAVSIMGVSRLRRQAWPLSQAAAVTENGQAPGGPDGATPCSPPQITMPAKTEIEVRLEKSVATNRSAPGDPFFATVANPVVVSGQTVIPEGAMVEGKVVTARKAGRLKGVAEIRLKLISVVVERCACSDETA